MWCILFLLCNSTLMVYVLPKEGKYLIFYDFAKKGILLD